MEMYSSCFLAEQRIRMASELISTEEVVNTLLENLVGPLLPLRTSAVKEAPSLSQQQSVAKQLHAVVLLYNYYQRKQNPQAQFLDFESFCKLAMTLRPVLVSYMKFTNQSNTTGSKDTDNDLSVTEKAIQDACNISWALDASKDVPSMNEWLIAKVSVLLLDSKKENCWLLFGSVTEGVWSLLEKCLDLPTAEIEGEVETKHLHKKKRTNIRPVTVEQKDDDSGFQQLAFIAVKDATGISRSDLMVLEEHVVYSLTKEKTSSCFYIMQCTQSANQDNQNPVKETLKSLQGPLVKRSSGGWSTTEVVEHFHLLPYASIMSAFFLRYLHFQLAFVCGELSVYLALYSLHAYLTTLCDQIDEGQYMHNLYFVILLDSFRPNMQLNKTSKKRGNVSIMSAKGSHSACSILVNDNNDRNANPADSFSAEVVANNNCEKNTGYQKDFVKENDVHHERVSAYGSFSGEAKEASASKGWQSIGEKIEKMEAKTPNESLVGTKSDRINLEISEAKDGDGPLEKVSHSAVGQEVDGSHRIRKSEEAGRDCSIRNKEIVDFSGDKLTGVNLECLNDTSNNVHHENIRDNEDSTAKEPCANINRPRTLEEKAEELVKSTKSCEINDFNDKELAGACREPLEVQMNDGYSSSPTRPQRMDIDACIPCSKNGNNSKDCKLTTEVYQHQNKRMRESGGEIIGSGVICKAPRTDEGKADKECGLSATSPNQNGISVAHTALVPYKHESMDIGDLPTVLASKEKALTQISLDILLHKREKLLYPFAFISLQYHQQLKIGDEMALCDKSIQRIFEGGKDNLPLKLDTVLDFSEEMRLKDRAAIQEGHQPDEELGVLQSMSERKLSKAVRTPRRACQDLYQICCVNNWMVPSYSQSATDGGFNAIVTVRGPKFLCSCESDLQPSSSEARESAAFQMITNLQPKADNAH
ncbi:uncharacterized protein LOC132038250 [Lycium ferocissimum]|uniref:uncharacterized protein LOC132038250 n=1 Tax=Lycium ferocissimum TaxID=112874 RepID=UPI0028165B61|nr:uncharacterized protein LOC132038250 [Lycium ferocissimum]